MDSYRDSTCQIKQMPTIKTRIQTRTTDKEYTRNAVTAMDTRQH